MPELPEVETIKRDLDGKITGKKIRKISVFLDRAVKNGKDEFIISLKGRKFESVDRIGKLLILEISGNTGFLLVHLKMTGQLIYRNSGSIIAGGHDFPGKNGRNDKYTRVEIAFADGSVFRFKDMRTFGYMRIVDKKELSAVKAQYGPEPFDNSFDAEYISGIFRSKNAPVKALLLNQKKISGLGNIYADEVLFASGILPSRPAGTLGIEEIRRIRANSRRILKKAIKFRGTTFRNYVDASGMKGSFSDVLKVYGRKGEPCFSCGKKIRKTRVAGRGTHFCGNCQK